MFVTSEWVPCVPNNGNYISRLTSRRYQQMWYTHGSESDV
jgi:hypothetical protein